MNAIGGCRATNGCAPGAGMVSPGKPRNGTETGTLDASAMQLPPEVQTVLAWKDAMPEALCKTILGTEEVLRKWMRVAAAPVASSVRPRVPPTHSVDGSGAPLARPSALPPREYGAAGNAAAAAPVTSSMPGKRGRTAMEDPYTAQGDAHPSKRAKLTPGKKKPEGGTKPVDSGGDAAVDDGPWKTTLQPKMVKEFLNVYACFATDLLARVEGGKREKVMRANAVKRLDPAVADRFENRRRCMFTWRYDRMSLYLADAVCGRYAAEVAAGHPEEVAGGNLLYRLCLATVLLNSPERMQHAEEVSVTSPLTEDTYREMLATHNIPPCPPKAVLQSARSALSSFATKSGVVDPALLPLPLKVDANGRLRKTCVIAAGTAIPKGAKIRGWTKVEEQLTQRPSGNASCGAKAKPIRLRWDLEYGENEYYVVFGGQYAAYLGEERRCCRVFRDILRGPTGPGVSQSDHTVSILREKLLCPPFIALLVARWLDVAVPRLPRLFDSDGDERLGVYARAGLYALCGNTVDEAVRVAKKPGGDAARDLVLFRNLEQRVAEGVGEDVLRALDKIHADPLAAQTLEHMLCEYRKVNQDGRGMSGTRTSPQVYRTAAAAARRVYRAHKEALRTAEDTNSMPASTPPPTT